MISKIFDFYESIFTGEAWDEIMEEFRSGSNQVRYVKDGKEIIDETYISDNGEPYSYADFEKLYFRKKARKLLATATEHFDKIDDQVKMNVFVDRMNFYLSLYSQKLEDRFKEESRRYILTSFLDAKKDIQLLMESSKDRIFGTPNQSTEHLTMGNKEVRRPKIKWLGNTNVLITLFYDLLHGQERADPLIEADKSTLKEFLLSNFLDSEGNPLSPSTIDTLFTPSKADKRSKIGDRIEIGNTKQKK